MTDSPPFKFEKANDCLIIRVLTRDILEKKAETFQALAAAIKTRSPKATLVDLRAVPGPVTFMDRYQVGEQTGRFLSGLTVAALMTEEQTDKDRIGQKVAMNRGARVEVFTDPACRRSLVEEIRHAGVIAVGR